MITYWTLAIPGVLLNSESMHWMISAPDLHMYHKDMLQTPIGPRTILFEPLKGLGLPTDNIVISQ